MRSTRGDIGTRIRVARKLAGVRVRDICEALGVVPMTVYRWEQGKHRASLESLEAVADYLRVSRAWLLTGEGEARAA